MADVNELLPVTDEDRAVAEAIVSGARGYAVKLPNDGHSAIQLVAQYRLATRAATPAMDREAVEREWLRGDWYERWQDATENADEELMATLESLRGRVDRTILAALSTLSADAIRQGEGATTQDFGAVPDGWKMVPPVMTPEMIEAWRSAPGLDCQAAYTAMLAATPASHASDGGKA